MYPFKLKTLYWLLLLFIPLASAAEFKAAVSRVEITPAVSIRMAGYGARTQPSQSVATPLWAKALAIEDRKGSRIVLITTDLIGLPRSVSDVVAARAQKEFGLDRSRLILNSSHTHAGPIVWPSGLLASELRDEQKRIVMEYRNTLVDQLVNAIGASLKEMSPADVFFGRGEAHFGVNRRQKTAEGVKIGINPDGPVDPRVPVLRVSRPDGSMLAVVFGYACHNTTLVGNNLTISGDYAGHAQAGIEKSLPQATAMFLMLCGADQNPNPRGTPENVSTHGSELTATTLHVVKGKMERLKGPISAAFRIRDLTLAQPLAKAVPYPIQAVRFGKGLTIVALGGEVVLGYAQRIEREFPKERFVVAGYSNDVMAYIPTAVILSEGGYEPVDSMKYYELPSPFAGDVEDRVMTGVREVLRSVGVR